MSPSEESMLFSKSTFYIPHPVGMRLPREKYRTQKEDGLVYKHCRGASERVGIK